MTPSLCCAFTNNVKADKGRIGAATIFWAKTSLSRVHLLEYHIVKAKLMLRLLQGERYPLVPRMRLVTGKLPGD